MVQRFTPRKADLSGDSGDELSSGADSVLRPKYGHYRVEKPVGKGAMGYVLKGLDEGLDRVVAIKVLAPELSGSADFVERFRREAKALATLDHPGIASIFSFGEESGEHYFAMQWCSGGTLSDLHEKSGRIETITSIDIVIQCAHALSAAWRKGIVHRDVKPSNIMFDENSRVKIVDFGLARSQAPSVSLTEVSNIIGTPSFMSPEQARVSKVDHRADIYSLGITLYFLLYGQLPFTDSTSIGILIKHATIPLPAYDDLGGKVPLEAYKIVERMTQKDPSQRYLTYDELILDLERLQKRLSPGESASIGDSGAREKYGPYVIEALVGGGRLGKLYKSFDETLRRFAALKILSKQFSDSRDLIEYFTRRSRQLSALDHPGIARFYNFGEHQGDYYFANEWCDGGSLADMIRKKGRIEVSKSIQIVLSCATALSAAADFGILHGNIRPKNILFDEGRETKIADFGWAARASREAPGSSGNSIFMAPERTPVSEPDVRSDIYSLGITFCCILYGIHPSQPGLKLDRDGISELSQKDPGRSVPSRVHDILVKMTQEDFEHRYSGYGSLIRDLGDVLRSEFPALYYDTIRAPLPADSPGALPPLRFEALADGVNLGRTGKPEVDRALDDLQAYLSDKLPPMIVSDSIALLIKLPPELTSTAIEAWVGSQVQGNQGIYVSDYLYHAVSKIHLLREYKLIAAEDMAPFMASLKGLILKCCPPGEREILEANLDQVEKAQTIGTGQVGSLRKPESTHEGTTLSSPSAPAGVTNNRFQLILRRLDKLIPAKLATGADPGRVAVRRRETMIGAALAEAARGARETADHNRLLDRMRDLGMDRGVEELLKALAHSLPGWTLPTRPDVKMPQNSNLAAIHGLIQKAPDPQEAASRFNQFVKAAMERFNAGALAAAVSMIELAQKIIDAKEVQGAMVQAVLLRGHENLDESTLRRYAEAQEQRPHLRKILDFFEGFSPQALLDSLRKEPRRERRRLLLTLLECHGEATREIALEYLQEPLSRDYTDEEIHFRRNLIHLIRHIPASQSEPVDRAANALVPHLKLELPSSVLKEALAAIAQVRHEKAERTLVQMLYDIEWYLLNPKQSAIESAELLTLADRVAAALCRLDTPGARKAVIDHALKKETKLGDARSRLAELSKVDLSDDRNSVDRLIEGIKSNPLKVLGVVVPQRDRTVKCIVEALSGTPLPIVRTTLGELADQFPDRETGRAATKGLSSLERISNAKQKPKTASSLTGEIDEYGLPNLLLSLADSQSTGALTLKKPAGELIGVIHLHKGNFKGCQCGSLPSEAAFYQLFEDPQPSTFQFISDPEDSDVPQSALQQLSPLVLEGIRRYDEVQQTKGIVPDDAKLIVKAAAPLPLPEEKDGLLFRNLWMAVQKGATAAECDAVAAVDIYRIRKLLAHWVQHGVIETS